jgi:V/A-type H+-transporting ATPase subunit I
MMRPRPARWFEALVARDDCTVLLDALARTGAVELEARAATELPAAFQELRPALARFAEFAVRYSAYWPVEALDPSPYPEPPGVTLTRDLEALEAWSREAEPIIRALQSGAAERESLERWRTVLAAIADSTLDPGALARAGPLARALLVECPAGFLPPVGPNVLLRAVDSGDPKHYFAAGPAAELAALEREAHAAKGRSFPIPAWITDSPEENLAQIHARLERLGAEERSARAALDALATRHALRRLLGDLYRLQWVIRNVRALESEDHFAWITGWTSDFEGRLLEAAVERSQARALLHFPAAPRNRRAPLLFANPAWARPFELFSRALGMPAGEDADPTQLLAIAVPLIFGYMFGDIAHGLIIAGVAWWLRHRFEVAKVLVSGGLAAAAFGLAFGSIFGYEGIVPALWLHPLENPLPVLAVPITVGAILLAIGLVLQALESWWHRDTARAFGADAGLLAAYVGTLAGFLRPEAWWLAAAGFAWFLAAEAIREGRARAALAALGEFAERLMQLLVNTLSFVRVGAFALAHAGLCSAVVALADAAPNAAVWLLVTLAGNALVLTLETLVVSIQTTRLVLFEFFTRFFTGRGRAFRPLPPPPFTLQE